MRWLLALLPGRISTPFAPPFSADSRLSRRNRLLGRSGPWQRRQELSRMGLMSRAKSIFPVVGGGSFDSSISAAARERQRAEGRRQKEKCHALNLRAV